MNAPASLRAVARGFAERPAHEPVCDYVYDVTGAAARVARLATALPASCRLFYAMKANPDPVLLRGLSGVVHGFEVASLGEVHKARAADRHARIIFGGPGKSDAELAGAVAAGVALVNVESVHELRRVDLAGARAGCRVPVLLRINLAGPLPAATLKMGGGATQFGIDEAELPSALAIAARCRHIDLRGFHLHSLSNNLDADAHLALLELYLDRLAAWERLLGRPVATLDVGGGIGVDYGPAARQFDWQRFCARLALLIETRRRHELELILECGRYLVAEAGAYVVEVLDLKHNHGAAFAVIRGGTHHFRLPASWQHSHPFEVVPTDRWPYPFERPELREERVTVVGQLCTPKDVLARDVLIPRLRTGDLLMFTHAGAYGWTISHHDFLSHPHPHVTYVGDGAGRDHVT